MITGSAVGTGAQRSMSTQYNNSEYSELLQTMVFLSCNRDESLERRIDQLDQYHNLLLHSWFLSEERSVLSAQNEIGVSTPINLEDNHPEVCKEFKEAYKSSILKIIGRKPTNLELIKRSKYWDRLAEASLLLLKEHVQLHLHSSAFVSGALDAVQWLAVSDDEATIAYDTLENTIRRIEDEDMRHRIFNSLLLLRKRYPKVCELFANDRDVHISQCSLYWLVINGEASYLPKYVHKSWKLADSGLESPKPVITINCDVGKLLTEIIPESGALFSEQSQLQWLENNLKDLQWDKNQKVYKLIVKNK